MFRSYIKALGFTLAKIEMPVFALYLKSSDLEPKIADKFIESFKTEYNLSLQALREVSGEQSLLWYRPWLSTSIGLRSPLIHPLNVLQLIALQKKDVLLLRETVTGIASGMLTTG
ncbi:phosphoenolpyruvate carboxylase [compost metagenome]